MHLISVYVVEIKKINNQVSSEDPENRRKPKPVPSFSSVK